MPTKRARADTSDTINCRVEVDEQSTAMSSPKSEKKPTLQQLNSHKRACVRKMTTFYKDRFRNFTKQYSPDQFSDYSESIIAFIYNQFNDIIESEEHSQKLARDMSDVLLQQSKYKGGKDSVLLAIYDNYTRKNEDNFVNDSSMQLFFTTFYQSNGH